MIDIKTLVVEYLNLDTSSKFHENFEFFKIGEWLNYIIATVCVAVFAFFMFKYIYKKCKKFITTKQLAQTTLQGTLQVVNLLLEKIINVVSYCIKNFINTQQCTQAAPQTAPITQTQILTALKEEITPLQLPENWIKSLKEIITCAICLDILHPITVQCVKGHAICQGCKGELTKCPTCLEGLLNLEANTLIRQILEFITHTVCIYCKQIVQKEHSKICGDRITICMLCQYTCVGRSAMLHLKKCHPMCSVVQENSKLSWPLFRLTEPFTDISVVSFSGYFFWKQVKNHPDKGIVSITFRVVPTGTRYNVFNVTFTIETKHKTFKTSLTLTMDPDQYENNSIFIPSSIVKDFTTNEKNLVYNLSISKADVQ